MQKRTIKKITFKQKDYKIILILFVCSLVYAILLYPQEVSAASRRATTINFIRRSKGEKDFGVIKGFDKNKKIVWKYKTKGYIAPWGDPFKCITYKNKVYLFEVNSLTVLKKRSGKRVWSHKTTSIADYECVFDKNNNIYIVGMSGTLEKLNSKGEVIWKTDKCECWWHGKLKLKKGKISITHDYYNNTGEARVTYSTKTGKILKIKYLS